MYLYLRCRWGNGWILTSMTSQQQQAQEKDKFSKQKQLTEYFIGQVRLLTKLCLGRSYNCIEWISRKIPYLMLVSMSENEHLPYLLRAASVELVIAIYLDRYPQIPKYAYQLHSYHTPHTCSVFFLVLLAVKHGRQTVSLNYPKCVSPIRYQGNIEVESQMPKLFSGATVSDDKEIKKLWCQSWCDLNG